MSRTSTAMQEKKDEHMLIFTFSHAFSLENGLFWDEFVLTKFWPELTLQMSAC